MLLTTQVSLLQARPVAGGHAPAFSAHARLIGIRRPAGALSIDVGFGVSATSTMNVDGARGRPRPLAGLLRCRSIAPFGVITCAAATGKAPSGGASKAGGTAVAEGSKGPRAKKSSPTTKGAAQNSKDSQSPNAWGKIAGATKKKAKTANKGRGVRAAGSRAGAGRGGRRGAEAGNERPSIEWTLVGTGKRDFIVLKDGENIIGSSSGGKATVGFDNPLVDAEHAVLCVDSKARQCTVRDAGSDAGTWLNGSRLRQGMAVRIYAEDSMVFGDPLVNAPWILSTQEVAAPKKQQQAPNANPAAEGNPLGKRVLGAPASAWLRAGCAAYARAFVAAAGTIEVGPGYSLVGAMQEHLDASPVPEGAEKSCKKGRTHYPTLWDLMQREVREVLIKAEEEEGAAKGVWRDTPAWKLLKAVPGTDEAKAAAATAARFAAAAGRGAAPRAAAAKTGAPAAVSAASRKNAEAEFNQAMERRWKEAAEAQKRVEEFVGRANTLLRLESLTQDDENQEEADVMNYQANVDGAEEFDDDVCVIGSPCGVEQTASAAMRNIAVVSTMSSLGGARCKAVQVKLMAFGGGGGRLPVNTLTVGETVVVSFDSKFESRRDPWAGVAGEEGVQALVDPVVGVVSGQDETSLLIEIDSKRAYPGIDALVGLPLQVSRASDEVTFERNAAAMERLRAIAKGVYVAARQYRSANRPAPPPAGGILSMLFSDPKAAAAAAVAAAEVEVAEAAPATPEEQEWAARKAARVEAEAEARLLAAEAARASDAAGMHAAGTRQVLDASQEAAVAAGLREDVPVTVIQGPPGTGKTGVLVELIRRATMGGSKVLAAAASNMAVDNLLERLASAGVRVVRIGPPQKVSAKAMQFTLSEQVDQLLKGPREEYQIQRSIIAEQIRIQEAKLARAPGGRNLKVLRELQKELRKMARQNASRERGAAQEVLKQADVVLATNTSAGDAVLSKLPPFDLVVLDEASQSTEPNSWIPLTQGRRAVLAGDPRQLAPTVRSRDALEGGLGVSLMERAMGLPAVAAHVHLLGTQYRMHACISEWSSRAMYDGRLAAAERVAVRTLVGLEGVRSEDAAFLAAPMLMLDTRKRGGALLRGCEELMSSRSLLNEGEGDVVACHVARLLRAGVRPEGVVVISPYAAQVENIRNRLLDMGEDFMSVEVATVDSFQGREAEAVVISMVRSNPRGAIGFLADARRMNVAVTRARRHVAVVADSSTVSANPLLEGLLRHIKLEGAWEHAADLVEPALGSVVEVERA